MPAPVGSTPFDWQLAPNSRSPSRGFMTERTFGCAQATHSARATSPRAFPRHRTLTAHDLSAARPTESQSEPRVSRNHALAGSAMDGTFHAKRLSGSSPLATAPVNHTTVAPATPPQFTSMTTRDVSSSSFADLKTHVAARGAAFTGRVAITRNVSSKMRDAGGSPMKRVASTPTLNTKTTTPAPGSQGMRDMFFVRQDNVNFNASYGTPVKEVLQKQWAYHVQCETSPHEWMLGVAAMKLRATRGDLAAYVMADVKDLVLVENCTAAATAVIRASELRAGDVVIHLSTAYGMVKNALQHAADLVGADVVSLPVEFRGRATAPVGRDGAPLHETLANAIDAAAASGRRVALVTFDYIASCPGAVMPVIVMARVCKLRNVPCVWADAAHALGQVRLDMKSLEQAGVTHLMADAHKWLYSPKGSAMLWVTRGCQAHIQPSVVGAVCSNSVTTNFDPNALAGLSEYERRFQYTGTRDYTPLVAVGDALRWRSKVGEANILGYNHGLAVWAQEFLSNAWGTETLVPAECTAFMAHVRVPVRTAAGAALLNARLREEHATHVMAFSLPARQCYGETHATHWVRPCAQLFVSRDDFRKLATATLAMAKTCDAAADVAFAWLGKTRARLARGEERARVEALALKAEEASMRGDWVAHAVTVGFDAPALPTLGTVERTLGGGFGRGARSDSARDLSIHSDLAAVEAVAKYAQGGLATTLNKATGADNENVGHETVSQTFASPKSAGYLPSLSENDASVGGAGKKLGEMRFGANSKMAASPVSVMDVSGTSAASSCGTSVDGSGFAHPEWVNRAPVART